MRRTLVFICVFAVVSVVAAGSYFVYRYQYIPIVFSSRHPGITITKKETKRYNALAALFLLPRRRTNFLKVVGVVFTDKVRAEYQQTTRDQVIFSSTSDVVNGSDLMIYIYVNPDVPREQISAKSIDDYVARSIYYYAVGKTSTLPPSLLSLFRLPIYVQSK